MALIYCLVLYRYLHRSGDGLLLKWQLCSCGCWCRDRLTSLLICPPINDNVTVLISILLLQHVVAELPWGLTLGRSRLGRGVEQVLAVCSPWSGVIIPHQASLLEDWNEKLDEIFVRLGV